MDFKDPQNFMVVALDHTVNWYLDSPLWNELDAKFDKQQDIIHNMPRKCFIHLNFFGPIDPPAAVKNEVGRSRHFPPMRYFGRI